MSADKLAEAIRRDLEAQRLYAPEIDSAVVEAVVATVRRLLREQPEVLGLELYGHVDAWDPKHWEPIGKHTLYRIKEDG